ncbi:MAG: sensor histidine kinase [Flavobacteriales bacterium]|jgi:PAS domain S-box-containing protein
MDNIKLLDLLTNKNELDSANSALLSLVQNISDIITLVNEEGKIIYQSATVRQSMGWAENELLGRNIFEVTHPEDHSIIKEQFEKALRVEGVGPQAEFRLLNKDGTFIYLDAQGNNQFHNPQIRALIITSRDITPRKMAELELKKANEILQYQNAQLQSFSQILSHNIRSHSANLSSIVDFIETSDSENEKVSFFDMLKTSTKKLEETIFNLNEILEINQKLKQPKETLNLKEEVQKTIGALEALMAQKNISAIIHVPDDIMITIVPAFLDSILLNLISNAIKYSDPDKDSYLAITAESVFGQVNISVKDNGLGIDLQRHGKKIFHLYKTFHEREDSRGLGLFMVKNQIEAMNGTISVQSEVGIGTTFKITLPNPATSS